MNFTYNEDGNEIVENGKDLALTYENRLDYVHATLNFIMNLGIRKQIVSFITGFEACLPASNLYTLLDLGFENVFLKIFSHAGIWASENQDHTYTQTKTFFLCAGSATLLKIQITGHEVINWKLNELYEFIEPKLGYTKASRTYLDLCDVLMEFTNKERKQWA